MGKKTKTAEYGERKVKYQFMLTPTTSEKLDKLAQQMEVSRSEVLERLLRKLSPSKEKMLLGKYSAS
jgi:metal-responsive CopG/Arc/MetJ family transcriptional regulator